MLVCSSHSSVFVREKCWYVVVIACVCNAEMLVCGSHSSVCKGEMLVCGSLSSVFVREKCWYVVVIALCL
jgi:ethanolamine utilization protein EutP (predicted NTPase)